MAVETLYVDAVASIGTLVSANNAVGAPDGVFTANVDNSPWTSRFSMQNPAGNTANGSHTFTLRVRKETGAGTPTIATVEFSEGGAILVSKTLDFGVTSTTGQDVVVTLTEAEIRTITSLQFCEVTVATTAIGGKATNQTAVQLDAITWSGDFAAPPTPKAGSDSAAISVSEAPGDVLPTVPPPDPIVASDTLMVGMTETRSVGDTEGVYWDRLLVGGSSATDATSFDTGSVPYTPDANRLLLLQLGSGSVGAVAAELPASVTGHGLTWTLAATGVAGLDDRIRNSVYWAWTGASPTTGVITINFTNTQSNVAYKVIQIGKASETPIVQSVVAPKAGDLLFEVTLPNPVAAGNAVFTFSNANNTTVVATPTREYTEINSGVGTGQPAAGTPAIRIGAAYHPVGTQISGWNFSDIGSNVSKSVLSIEIQEGASGTPVAGSDTSSIAVSETTSLAITNTTTDTAALSLAETVALTKAIESSDTNALSVTEVTSFASDVIVATSDTASLSLVETGTTDVTVASSDTSGLTLTEASTAQKNIEASDSASISLAENSNAGSTLPGSETVAISISETSAITMSVKQYIADYYPGIAATGSELYVVPTAEQITTMRSAWASVVTGNLAAANTTASALGYEARQFVDSDTGRTMVLFHEPSQSRHWGSYLWSPNGLGSRISYVVTHPKSDLHTHTQGIEMFISDDANMFAIAGAHRNANAALDANGDRVSDVANTVSSVLQGIVEETVNNASWTLIEPHGYADSTHTTHDVVLSNGSATPPQSLYDLQTSMATATGLRIDLYTGQAGHPLGATGNRQGTWVRSQGSLFLHLEQNSTVRTSVTTRQSVQNSVTTWTTTQEGVTVKSGSDAISISASETVSTLQNVSTTTADTASLSVTESSAVAKVSGASDTAVVVLSETSALTKNIDATDAASLSVSDISSYASSEPKSASDTTALSISEMQSVNKNLTASDVAIIAVDETGALFKNIAVTDTSNLSVSETTTSDKTIVATDTASLSVTDIGNVSSTLPGNESIVLAVAETTITANTSGASDALALGMIDESVIAASQSSVDTATLSVSETSSIFVIQSTTDASTLNLVDTHTVNVVLVASDTSTLALEEASETQKNIVASDSTSISLGDTATLHNSLTGSDATALSVGENSNVGSTLPGSETVSLAVIEQATILITQTVTDASTLAIVDTSGVQVSKSATDQGAVSVADAGSVVIGGGQTIAASESAAITVIETSVVSITIQASDAVALSASEATAFVKSLTAVDNNGLSIVETTSSLRTVTANDSATISVTEITGKNNDLPGADSTSLGISDIATIYITSSATDTSTLAVTDTGLVAMASQNVNAGDTAIIMLAETTSIVKAVAGTDSAGIGIVETVELFKQIAASDIAAISLTEESNNGLGVEIMVYQNGVWVPGIPMVYRAGQWRNAEVSIFKEGEWR